MTAVHPAVADDGAGPRPALVAEGAGARCPVCHRALLAIDWPLPDEVAMPQVLIVDDDEALRQMLELLVKTSGYDTVTAANGVEGLEQMRRQLPCLVLLDIQMPQMDGFEFRRHQLADPTLARVPVVCLTGHYEPEQVGSQLRVACLKKPLHFPDVIDAVEAQCGPGRPSEVRETLRGSLTRPDEQLD